MPVIIDFATTDDEIRACFPVMAELRPRLVREEFVPTVRRLMDEQGYRLAYLADEGVKTVAGLRIGEWLPLGRYLEIEDLVTEERSRSRGYGGWLFDWLVAYASGQGCRHLRLVSALRRTAAHRFYEEKGMKHTARYYSLDVSAEENPS